MIIKRDYERVEIDALAIAPMVECANASSFVAEINERHMCLQESEISIPLHLAQEDEDSNARAVLSYS